MNEYTHDKEENKKSDYNSEQISAIKQEIGNLVRNLESIKGHSGEIINEQLDSLYNLLGNIKNQAIETERNNLAMAYSAIRRHPGKSLLFAFSIGFWLAYLIRK